MTEKTLPPAETADLLVELGCEELPPKALDGIRSSFFDAVKKGLESSHIGFSPEISQSFSSPRRLAVLFRDVAARQPDQEQERRGPALSAAFDDNGKPTGAALGFARSVGKDVSELETLETDKGQWLCANLRESGKSLSELIYPILEQAIKELPVPRPMRWADHDFSFVRPVHWLVVMHGENVLEGHLLGHQAANLTRGHRIHSPGPHSLPDAASYERVLMDAFVMVDQERRKSQIRDSLVLADPQVRIDPELLREVNNLVEWPVAVVGTFDKEFLEVPHAALIASMQDHQKFFPVQDKTDSTRVSNRFIAISNIESSHTATVREGYERVIRPRLADARFFLEQDQKQALEANLALLDRAIFQNKIGTIGDKSRRIAYISTKIAEVIAENPDDASRAALLSKCDLMTQMVGEFPELQGVMGQHYALASGESCVTAQAIGEHYAPRFAGDQIPASSAGKIVSMADRLDTLTGIFAAGIRPSGNKDPFALRRSALGLVRILIEAELDLPLNLLLSFASEALAEQIETSPVLLAEVREFIIDRLGNYYRDQGFGAELINAVRVSGWDTLADLDRRLRALADFMGQEDAASLAAANKRIGNILRKSDESNSTTLDTARLLIEEEKQLFDEIMKLESQVAPLFESGDYSAGLKLLASLRQPVDGFFDAVMVMDDDTGLRLNRLSLLARMKSLFDRVADLSVLG